MGGMGGGEVGLFKRGGGAWERVRSAWKGDGRR